MMPNRKLTRDQLVRLVEDIVNVRGSEEEIHEWLGQVQDSVPHPNVSDLIYYSDVELSPNEIVDVALGYQAIKLEGGQHEDNGQ
jgi:hypothetical protein